MALGRVHGSDDIGCSVVQCKRASPTQIQKSKRDHAFAWNPSRRSAASGRQESAIGVAPLPSSPRRAMHAACWRVLFGNAMCTLHCERAGMPARPAPPGQPAHWLHPGRHLEGAITNAGCTKAHLHHQPPAHPFTWASSGTLHRPRWSSSTSQAPPAPKPDKTDIRMRTWAVIWNAPSPTMVTTRFSGAPNPYPRVAPTDQPMDAYCREGGWVGGVGLGVGLNVEGWVSGWRRGGVESECEGWVDLLHEVGCGWVGCWSWIVPLLTSGWMPYPQLLGRRRHRVKNVNQCQNKRYFLHPPAAGSRSRSSWAAAGGARETTSRLRAMGSRGGQWLHCT